jgi:nicotinic acid mononucleotide adenylyltransferase
MVPPARRFSGWHRTSVDQRALATAIGRAARPGRPRLEILGASPRPVRSVGLVAGSFDPMTVAHAALAEALGTDLTLLVWSPATLPKETGPGGTPSPTLLEPEAVLASLVAWCEPRTWARAAVSSHGLLVDQVEAAASSFPRSRLVLGMGSDKLRQLFDRRWYEDRDSVLDRLFDRAEVATAARSGAEPDVVADEPRWSGRIRAVRLPAEVAASSSRTVREAVRAGRDVSSIVPPEVLPFVREG